MDMRGRHSPTWFGSLRRDGRTFALLCCFSLLLAILQPMAAAAAETRPQDGFVICTQHGTVPAATGDRSSGTLRGGDQPCPCCFGHLCSGLPLLDKVLAAAALAFPHPAGPFFAAWSGSSGPAPDAAGAALPPPARAPPISA
jgi:hypothetical protein